MAQRGAPEHNPYLAALLAWLVPGAGHAFVGRRSLGAAFFALVIFSLTLGIYLDGLLSATFSGHPLEILRTLGCLGLGLPYFVARFGLEYAGTPQAVGFEYGGAFILTAGIMNLLLVLDAWDIARGQKEIVPGEDEAS